MTKKRTEVVGWHSVRICTTDKNACEFEVVTPHAGRLMSVLSDPDVVALSWESGSQEFLVRTEQVVLVVIEELKPAQLDDGDREELLAAAVPLTASIMFRTRIPEQEQRGDCFVPRYWTQLFPPSEGES